MPQPARNLSIRRSREHQQALEAFRDVYRPYLAAYLGRMPDMQSQRAKVTTLIPAGQWAIRAAGMEVGIASPPTLGGPVRTGLSNTAFAHEVLPELPLPHGGIPESARTVLDVTEQSIGFLKELEKEAIRRRRGPTYWGDRVLRALLGFPAYLIELVFGVSRWRIEASKAGLPLRMVGLASEVAIILEAGRVFKLW